MDFSSHSFCKFTFSMSGLLLFSPISCIRSSPVLFVSFFSNLLLVSKSTWLSLCHLLISTIYVTHYRANKLSCWLRHYFQCVLYLNLPSKRNKTRKVTCTCLANLHGAIHCAFQWLVHGKYKSTLFHTYSSASPHGRRQIRIQEFYFPFPYMCSLILCVLWTLSLDTDLTLWKLSRLLKDNKQCSGEKDILHKTWVWKHPKLITNKNCIGRWICLAMLEEKLQWRSINLQNLRTTKNDLFGNILEHTADLLNLSVDSSVCIFCDRPIPIGLCPLFQSESSCSSFHLKISFHLHVNVVS